jgi:hypothetical protein
MHDHRYILLKGKYMIKACGSPLLVEEREG